MVRTYKRKTTRGNVPVDDFQRASQAVREEKMSLRDAATRYGMNFMTLQRYIKKSQSAENSNTIVKVGYTLHRKVFSDDQENELATYAAHSAKLYYGLTTSDLRKLAYEYAVANNIAIKEGWKTNSMASKDWLFGFLKRHSNLSIRKPEATSLARATAFNRHTVSLFFENLGKVYEKYKFGFHEIYNVDETGLTTVQRPSKIIATKGTKQVGAITSAERGTLITLALAVSASGNSVPPFLIFPRKKFKNIMLANAPPGCVGAVHPSGWMTNENFLLFVQHFVQFTRCSKEKPILLILDNHESHLSIPVLNFCKTNGVVLLSFPPHTSHKLQPLDRAVFGPLKRYFNTCADGWLKSNPGKTMNIYDIPLILKESLPLAATPSNIQKGFAVAGIWPFNQEVFQDDEFLPSEVTNRPFEGHENNLTKPNLSERVEVRHITSSLEPSTSHASNTIEVRYSIPSPKLTSSLANTVEVRHSTPSPEPSTSHATCTTPSSSQMHLVHRTPQDVMPYPKAPTRKNTQGRRKRTSAILTDTPVKSALEEEASLRENKKRTGKTKQVSRFKLTKRQKMTAKKSSRKSESESEDSENEDTLCLACLMPFSKSRNTEWIRCTRCKRWAHVSCSNNDDFYICIHCMSDSD